MAVNVERHVVGELSVNCYIVENTENGECFIVDPGAEAQRLIRCVGERKVRGVLLGVFLLQLVNAGLVFLNFEPAVMTVIKGAIILCACALDMRKYLVKK